MKDIRIIPDTSGSVSFSIVGGEEDNALLLLQRLYTLLFSDQTSEYRGGSIGSALLAYMDGGNIPSTGVLDAAISMSCTAALTALDSEDRKLIQSFSGTCSTGTDSASVVFVLELVDGTTIRSVIENV